MGKWIAAIGAMLLLLIAVLLIQTDRQLMEDIEEVRTVEIPREPIEALIENDVTRVPDAPPAVPPVTPPPPPEEPVPPEESVVPEEVEPVEPAVPPEEPEPAPPEAPSEEVVIPEEEPSVVFEPLPHIWRPSPQVEPDEEDQRLPHRWLDPVQEQQPGFVDPDRLDSRSPTGRPILSDPLPTGPGGGWYE